jgi:hypothetical protein
MLPTYTLYCCGVFHCLPGNILTIINYFNQTFEDKRRLHYNIKVMRMIVFNIEELSFVFDSDSFVKIFQNCCSTRINKNYHFLKVSYCVCYASECWLLRLIFYIGELRLLFINICN